MLNNKGYTHMRARAEHVILMTFPRQEWSRERTWMLRLCIHCLPFYFCILLSFSKKTQHYEMKVPGLVRSGCGQFALPHCTRYIHTFLASVRKPCALPVDGKCTSLVCQPVSASQKTNFLMSSVLLSLFA